MYIQLIQYNVRVYLDYEQDLKTRMKEIYVVEEESSKICFMRGAVTFLVASAFPCL